MTEAEKRTPQEIADAIKETVQTLNEHLGEAYDAGLIASVESYSTYQMDGAERVKVAASVVLKL